MIDIIGPPPNILQKDKTVSAIRSIILSKPGIRSVELNSSYQIVQNETGSKINEPVQNDKEKIRGFESFLHPLTTAPQHHCTTAQSHHLILLSKTKNPQTQHLRASP